MATNRIEAAKTGDAAPKPNPEAAEAPSVAAAPGGIKAWLPLIIALVAMPALAYATTTFLLLPKLKKALKAPAEEVEHAPSTSEHGSAEGGHGGETKPDAKGRIVVPLSKKILVNVAGTMGTRYLLVNVTIVGKGVDLRANIANNQDQLMDLASSTLATKTITDLEKPGARNLIRTELIAAFNTALGANAVQELYFTEFAIQ
jgi:flagellar FliL protein